MIGHYLRLAVRNVPRAGPYVLLSIVGLGIGLGAALSIALYVHDELSYERWLPDSDRVYLVSVRSPAGGMTDWSPSNVGQWIAADYPQFDNVTRLTSNSGFFKRDEHEFDEQIFWADPNFFDVFRFPVVAGTLDGALAKPDSVVLTRRYAEKYFGRPDPLGLTLLLDGKRALTVTAVIEDLPSNTHFQMDVLASGVSADSPITQQDAIPMTVVGAKAWSFHTYARLARGQSIAPLRESIRTLPDRHTERAAGGGASSDVWPLIVRPIRTLHLSAFDVASPDSENLGRLYGALGIGALIILAAAINFVTLKTALAMRRAVEIGVRKACGGSRRALFVQFMSEVLVHVSIATLLGVALAAAALPALDAFLLRTIAWQTLLGPAFIAGIAALIVVVTLLAGGYPAFVLASFRPSVVTKARSTGRLQSRLRQTLVALQFAIVIAVMIATIVVHRQTAFGMRESLRQLADPIVQLRATCSDSFRDAMARLPGVAAVACSRTTPQVSGGGVGPVQYNGSERLVLGEVAVDANFFQLFGIGLAAGRYFSEDVGADETPKDLVWSTPQSIVLNEAGVKKLGIASPQAAIGKIVTINHPSGLVNTFSGEHPAQIVGVVKDFQMGSVRNEIFPTVFYMDSLLFHVVSMKLDGSRVPETLVAIDRLWREIGDPGPPSRWFFDDTVEQLYGDMRRDFELFTVFASVAILISVLGLVGLAAYAAAARTREIGVRKVLGSGRGGIMRLLLWEFGKPVLLANLIAWPAAYFAMSGWLAGFARRIELEPWMFLGAALATFAIAQLTVAAHAWAIAAVRPVTALRHE